MRRCWREEVYSGVFTNVAEMAAVRQNHIIQITLGAWMTMQMGPRMTILTAPLSDTINCDVCIIGAGPVGIALALECERLGFSVLIFEAGGKKAPRPDRGATADIATSNSHVPMHIATRHAFGGTSWAWSGVCGRFDDIDFHVRDYVHHSGWPLAHSEVAPFYDRAANLLNCRLDETGRETPYELKWISTESTPSISSQPKLAVSYWEHFHRSRAITLCLNSPVIGLDLGPGGERVEAISVAGRDRILSVRAPRVILAAGGLKTTQLLLATQRQWPCHFGGREGALGRFYMGHLSGWISTIRLNSQADAEQLFYGGADGTKMMRRLTIAGEKQVTERLFNIAFWPVAPLYYDQKNSQAKLSAHMALSVPQLGEWLAGGFAHALLGPPPRRIGTHIRNILKAPATTASGTIRAVMNTARARANFGSRAKQKSSAIYSLRYHAESEPNAESRVTLAKDTDQFGLPRVRIKLLFGDKDARSVVRAHEVLDEALKSAGKGQLFFWRSDEQREKSVLDQASDGYHQMGTTRMGTNPTQSVVDKNCRVHGIANLFIASSSIFPTGGAAHPTLLTTALGLRLAAHLAGLA